MVSWGGLGGLAPPGNSVTRALPPGGVWGASPPRNLRYPCHLRQKLLPGISVTHACFPVAENWCRRIAVRGHRHSGSRLYEASAYSVPPSLFWYFSNTEHLLLCYTLRFLCCALCVVSYAYEIRTRTKFGGQGTGNGDSWGGFAPPDPPTTTFQKICPSGQIF